MKSHASCLGNNLVTNNTLRQLSRRERAQYPSNHILCNSSCYGDFPQSNAGVASLENDGAIIHILTDFHIAPLQGPTVLTTDWAASKMHEMRTILSRSYAIWTHHMCRSLGETPATRLRNQNRKGGTLRAMPVRFTKEEDEMILKYRDEGMTFDTIANLLQRARPSIRTRFARLAESKGPAPAKGLFSESEDQVLFERRRSGHSFKDIAKELGRSYWVVANRFHSIVARRDLRHYRRATPKQASARISEDDDSLIIQRKAEGATTVQIARELRIESPKAHKVVASRWRTLQLQHNVPLPWSTHEPVTAELARRVIELRTAGNSFGEIAVLEGSSVRRVEGIFYRRKRHLAGKRTTPSDVLPNANSEQTCKLLQLPQASVHGLHQRQKRAGPQKDLRRWTPEQDEQLWRLLMQNGRDWEALRLQMPNRTVEAIRKRYHRIRDDSAVPTRWLHHSLAAQDFAVNAEQSLKKRPFVLNCGRQITSAFFCAGDAALEVFGLKEAIVALRGKTFKALSRFETCMWTNGAYPNGTGDVRLLHLQHCSSAQTHLQLQLHLVFPPPYHMPAHHRPRTRRSAQAPVGRLPLGTPSLDKHIAEAKAAKLNNAHSDSDSPNNTSVNTAASHTMSDVENHESAAARAEAKLRRQQERIQQADPMIKPVEKPRPSRKQAWKPLDLSDLMPPPPPMPNVDEVRVNRYPAQSRDTSLSRSMSSLSQQTAATGGVEMDRNDSATMYDNAGFQMYTGRRRTRQAMTEQSANGEPPVQDKPKTVEAEYDQNEILKVFKKQLPGLDYLTTNAGMADGEVHFVQHPNGDVSARIWSAKDYEWCPIGHFSNIRKKVEGQLAGDRLKGETAYQKLQQNTLAYFRILAKQREALAMGKPFGQNDIKQALPEPQQPGSWWLLVGDNLSPQQPRLQSMTRKPKPYEPLGTFNTISAGPHRDPATPTSHSRRENTMLPEVRSAMLDQLHQLGDRASKRSMSNINLATLSRTVMNDPYQQTEPSEYDEEHTSPPLSMSTQYSRPQPITNSSFPVAISHAGDIKAPTATRRGMFGAEFEEMCAGWQDSQLRPEQTERKTSVLTNGSVPDVGYEKQTPTTYNTEPIGSGKPTHKPHDVELNDWWTSGQKFARQGTPSQEDLLDFYRHIISTAPPKPNPPATLSTPQKTSFGTPVTQPRPIGAPMMNRGNSATQKSDAIPEADKVDITRLLIPVYENLASYTQGPNRRDYWCRWSQPPEWCIDRSPKGNESFFDSVWGQPPARVGRDPRYRNMPGELRFGGFSPGYSQQSSAAVGSPGAVKGTTGSFGSVGMAMGGGSLGRLGYADAVGECHHPNTILRMVSDYSSIDSEKKLAFTSPVRGVADSRGSRSTLAEGLRTLTQSAMLKPSMARILRKPHVTLYYDAFSPKSSSMHIFMSCAKVLQSISQE
ncbi:uncharacterized protein MYCFIDRAFT_206679 [Pseudocercospora fijiensis CIRAD86]|uniref:Myb-like domain-containing protein n=1 Tax=Pseudocercospora fijiensis (strain CIRAD86) TaxID=383855 RepID=M3B9H2_PSEFD|nr:uncharacterized protein MYCFIDRAFT_206679 [Pseudocercospora fijiensis CIRAD86]EME85977.1 hypothetical protein MYCFIDRAFT_206679 [Pseudocercospora fijiensis CIRAD86]